MSLLSNLFLTCLRAMVKAVVFAPLRAHCTARKGSC